MVDGDGAADYRQTVDWPDDENSAVGADGRLSAIMPRKLFQDDAAVKSGLLQVFVRMKPLPAAIETCMVLDKNNMLKATWRNKEAVYKFSRVFQQDADQKAVYAGTTSSLVEDFLHFRQLSAVVMAYGVTSAGKTFTMQGTPDKPGLVPLALKDIFQNLKEQSRERERVSLSVCEIYNENIHDLLAPAQQRAKPAALRLKEEKLGVITVVGAAELEVHSTKEALELLRKAAKARQSAGTGVNEHSSRSHAVITVKLQTVASNLPPSQEAPQQSFLHFVDLAGCERVKRTGNSGARLRESVAINSSLMTLARCLEVLRYNQQHPADQKVIPFRESKITHLFKGVLHGNGRFVMVVNVSPASEAFNETKRVLQYAALASKVTMTSEIEHDIAGDAWPSTCNPPAEFTARATATADAAAAATAASAALSAAQARIEELLDDKADLEYEIDVVERKVELLREELIKSEVEKEQLEADIRAEVQAEMQQLIQEATAKATARAAQAEDEAAAWKQKVADLQQQLDAHATELQRHRDEQTQLQVLQDALDEAKRTMLPLAEHQQLLKEARNQAAAALAEQQSENDAKATATMQDHKQQISTIQEQLLAAKKESEALQQRLSTKTAEAQQQVHAANAAASQQVSDLKNLVTDALHLLEKAVGYQQRSAADAQELASTAEAALAVQKQQRTLQEESLQQEEQDIDHVPEAPMTDSAGASAPTNTKQVTACDVTNTQQHQLRQPQPSKLADVPESEQLAAEQGKVQLDSDGIQQQQEQQAFSCVGADMGDGEAAVATKQQLPKHQSGPQRRTRRATLAVAVVAPVPQDTSTGGEMTTAPVLQDSYQQRCPADEQYAMEVATRHAVTADTNFKLCKHICTAEQAAVCNAETSKQPQPASAQELLRKAKRSSRRSTCRASPAVEAATSDVMLLQQAAHGAAAPCQLGRLPLDSIAEDAEEQEGYTSLQQAEQMQRMDGAAKIAAEDNNAVAAAGPEQHIKTAPRKRRRAGEDDANVSCKQFEAATAAQDISQEKQQEQVVVLKTTSSNAEPDRRKRRRTVGRDSVREQEQQQQQEATQKPVHSPKQGSPQAGPWQCAEGALQVDNQGSNQAPPAEWPADAMQVTVQQQPVAALDEETQQQGRTVSAGLNKSRRGNKGGQVRGTKKSHKPAKAGHNVPDKHKPPDPQQSPQQPAQLELQKPSQETQLQLEQQQEDVLAAEDEQGVVVDAAAVKATKSMNTKAVAGKLDYKGSNEVTSVQPQPAVAADEGWQSAERVLQDVTQQQLGAAVGRRATFAAGGGRPTAAAAGKRGAVNSKQQHLPHIAGGITPVAFRTRHRGAR